MPEINEVLKFDPEFKSELNEENSIVSDILKFDPEKTVKEDSLIEQNTDNISDLSWKKALTEGFSNIPSSGWNYAKDMASTIIHPIETTKALTGLAEGFSSKLFGADRPQEKIVDAVIDFYKGRYKTTDAFKEAIAKDPVGVLSDFASIVLPVGGAVGIGGKISGSSKAANISSKISKLATNLEPLNIVKQISALPFKLIPEKVPIAMYQHAVKFNATLSELDKLKVTKTALEYKILPTRGGLEKVQKIIDSYNEEITKIINDAANTGKTIKLSSLYVGLKKIKNKMLLNTDQPLVVEAAFKSIKEEWAKNLKVNNIRTPQQVQNIKQKIYNDLKTLYDKHKTSPALATLRKATAKNAKRQLELLVPEIKNLNFEEGKLIALYDAIESRANTISNQEFFNFGLAMRMATGGGVGSMVAGKTGASIGTAAGIGLAVFSHPQVKSRLAILINDLTKNGVKVKNIPTLTRLGLYEVGQLKEISDEEKNKQPENIEFLGFEE